MNDESVRYVGSVSWGKDSLCMLLMLIEKKYPLDEVIFFDTGMEFQAIYDTRDQTLPLLEKRGIKYTELRPEHPFEWYMFEKPVNGKNGEHCGYSWCGGSVRWGTALKREIINRYLKQYEKVIQYVGIAHDEFDRYGKAKTDNKRYPLVEWGVTEGAALLYCYEHGYRWLENGIPLYTVLNRVSCWCCTNKNLKELKAHYVYLPEYWEKLRKLQERTDRPFKSTGQTISDLEERFKKELEEANLSIGPQTGHIWAKGAIKGPHTAWQIKEAQNENMY